MKTVARMIAVSLTFGLLLGCFSCGQPKQAEKATLTVAAAADLETVFNEIGKAFESETGTHVVFSYGASGNLKKQIENGAPFDVFASANAAYVSDLAKEGLIVPDRQRIYAEGQITLWQRKDAKTPVNTLSDLTKPEITHIAIANPAHAPYGQAAVQSLQSAGIYDQVKSKLVLGENIAEALQFVESGNAEVGIVARALSAKPDGKWVLIDPATHQPIDQAVCILKSSKNQALAGQFFDYLGKPAAVAELKRFGFSIPNASSAE
ncbi:MAG TPA: molybdate ABC transporter substrate-binding protein [Blastocatellia bacterium]